MESRPVTRLSPDVGPPPLLVVAVSPADGASDVDPTAQIEVTLSRAVDPATLGNRPVLLTRAGLAMPVDGTAVLDQGGSRLVFSPAGPLDTPAVLYRIDLDDGLRAADGGTLDREESLVPLPSEFTTLEVVDVAPPVFGGVEQATPISTSAVNVRWAAAQDDTSAPHEITYRVYLGLSPAAVDFGVPRAESGPGALEVLVTGLEEDTLYEVAVRATDRAGNEDRNTRSVAARTLAERDTEPPVFAGARGARPLTTTSVEVFWDPATDNRDLSANIRYRVYLSTTPDGFNFATPRLTTGPGAGTAEVIGLTPDRLYYLVVRAVDTSDNESTVPQVVVSVRPLASWAVNVSPVLRSPTGRCAISGCHNAITRAGGINGTTYQGWINGGFSQDPKAIEAFDAQGSLVIWRCDERHPQFQELLRMPQGRTPLTPDILDTIIRWIDQGALNN